MGEGGGIRFLFFLFLFTYIVALYVYAWQRHRAFEEYSRCMASLEACCPCPCLYKFLKVVLRPCGALMSFSLYLLGRCAGPVDGFAAQKCPACRMSCRRCLQHSIGACFYSSTRIAVAVEDKLDEGRAKRMVCGPAPDELRTIAKDIAMQWEAGRLGEAIGVLENSCKHIDAYKSPFKELRELVVKDICDQLEQLLKPGGSDLISETAAFLARTEINYGKDTGPGAHYADNSELFANAGPMERASALIGQLTRIEVSLDDKGCRHIRPILDTAARDRVDWATSQSGHKPLQYALFCAGTLQALKLKEVVDAGRKYKELRGLPTSWDVLKLINNNYGTGRLVYKPKVYGTLMGVATSPGSTAWALQQLLDDTYKKKYTRDRGDGQVPDRLVLVHAQEVQNDRNYVEYMRRRQEIADDIHVNPLDIIKGEEIDEIQTMQSKGIDALPKLDASAQEAWLWHGTTQAGAEGITSEDFRLNFAGSGAGTLYGRGIYLAEMCSKSDEYTKEEGAEHYLLLCRATLGRCYYCDVAKPKPQQLEDHCRKGIYHSVLGDREKIRDTYREIMVYDDDQVYPAYIIRYRRQYYT